MDELVKTWRNATKTYYEEDSSDFFILRIFVKEIQFLDFLHVDLCVPWWAVIAGVTFISKLFIFIPAVIAHRYVKKRIAEDIIGEVQTFEKHSAVKRTVLLQLVPIGYSMYLILEFFVNVWVFLVMLMMIEITWTKDSMKTSGILWVEDLTRPDCRSLLALINLIVLVKICIFSYILIDAIERTTQVLFIFPYWVVASALFVDESPRFSAGCVFQWTVSSCLILLEMILMGRSINALFRDLRTLRNRHYYISAMKRPIQMCKDTNSKSALIDKKVPEVVYVGYEKEN